MKVGLVIGNYDAHGGGAERWTDLHARMLLDRGHAVHLLARRFSGAPNGSVCHVLDIGRTIHGRRLRFGRCAEAMLDTLDLDVVHDMGDGWSADLFMPHHGTRRGGFVHKIDALPPILRRGRRLAYRLFPRYREFRALERRQYDLSSRHLYLAVSRMIGDQMQAYHGVPEDRVRVVHNGVDIERFRPTCPERRAAARSELNVADQTLYLTVALDFRRKGVDTLIRAMGRVVTRAPEARLVVVGDGPINRHRALARAAGCEEQVRFVGDQPDPLPYYQAADVFVLPTRYDPCSLVVLEAMATGLPVITTTLNGVHELITQGEEGRILEDAEDDVQLAAEMSVYLDDDARVAGGAAARALAASYSIEHMFEAHLRIYKEIAERRVDAIAGTVAIAEG